MAKAGGGRFNAPKFYWLGMAGRGMFMSRDGATT
jgi:hypothetical protein